MTKIIIDKQTAIRAVYHLFNIPCCGTNPEIIQKLPMWPVEVIFDFEHIENKITITKPATLSNYLQEDEGRH